MTLQLHTTVQMLLNLVPLARKVYGTKADDFLSNALSQATGGSPPSYFPSDRVSLRHHTVELFKTQVQNTVLAQGCVGKWANSTPAIAVTSTGENSNEKSQLTNSNDKEDKCHGNNDNAAAMA
eukprot:jgi/Phyca11/508281/fgenesh2_kg.PHYCAscaffold_33_\